MPSHRLRHAATLEPSRLRRLGSRTRTGTCAKPPFRPWHALRSQATVTSWMPWPRASRMWMRACARLRLRPWHNSFRMATRAWRPPWPSAWRTRGQVCGGRPWRRWHRFPSWAVATRFQSLWLPCRTATTRCSWQPSVQCHSLSNEATAARQPPSPGCSVRRPQRSGALPCGPWASSQHAGTGAPSPLCTSACGTTTLACDKRRRRLSSTSSSTALFQVWAHLRRTSKTLRGSSSFSACQMSGPGAGRHG
mmetsp:Transcript_100365/g.318705  ORF Transcript_100365/g.318705 Transcript_100365/m.318705 type:complete len:250 (-) Transcript_100365:46-795(-)